MTPEQVKSHMETGFRELTAKLVAQQEEIKELGGTKTVTSQAIEKLEKGLEEMSLELKDMTSKVGAAFPSNAPKTRQSPGEIFVESAELKTMVEQKARVSGPVAVMSLTPPSQKALTSTQMGNFIRPERIEELFLPVMPGLSVRDLFNVETIDTNSIEFVRMTGFFPVRTTVATLAAIGATTIEVVSTAGLAPGQAVLIGTESRVVNAITDEDTFTITVGLTAAKAVGTRVVSTLIAPTVEGGLKPTGDWETFTVETEAVKTIAASVDATRQVLDDMNQLRAYIDNQLRFELSYSEQYQLLYGNGTSPNIRGVLSDPDIQVYNWSQGITGDTRIDAARRALTRVQLARYPADGIVVNPLDWESMQLQKDSEGRYLWINVNDGGEERFFRVPVSVSEAISAGTALTGSFKLGATIWDREDANIRVSEDYKDYFKRNMVAILGEERIALTVFRPEAFVKIVFDNAPA